ncbi:polysialyltransferase family glycosyltransferase [Sphaerisporangium sp. TRM90804]|uniref:polysialyltransferase family glycosyltransferase n=1 Tax=Sphaerisporangium sp. TRM90804 TaxID=3031113 RepID=UPI0024470E8B|nr:polysialyltransferase family glycosyltransferase [Sphaerisporangium sp. TRM90804]MDH2429555.1 polysialyltransferase family glycosyltransferase [Sphaerisporangium sp. TRM90804]
MTQVFYSSTLFGAMTLAAAVDAGRFGARTGRRVLLVSNNAAIPEITPSLDETAGFEAIRPRFDEVWSYNDIVAPLHPSDWRARVIEVPMLSRMLRAHLRLADGPAELIVESIAVPPARTLAGLIRDCPITVYSDGLMSYGPTRDPLPLEISGRITRLLHLDLVPELTPLLLREAGVAPDPLPDAAFHRVLADIPAPEDLEGDAVILGQYLSALDIVTAEEEERLHADMLAAVAARGHTKVLFKPHPAAGHRHSLRMRAAAAELGVELHVAGETVPAEVCFKALRPKLVVGCFSTALVTAHRLFGLPIATMGCDVVLERLAPYENSNRVPVTIVDATVPRLSPDGTITEPPAADVPALVEAVGFCMQSEHYPELRDAAAAYIETHGAQARYFKNRRLASVGLVPAPEPPTTASRALGRLRRVLAR